MSQANIPTTGGRLSNLRRLRDDRVSLLIELTRNHPTLVRLPLGVVAPVVVNSPELAHQVLVERADHVEKSLGLTWFAKPLLGEGLVTARNAQHKPRRQMLAPAFMPKYIAGYARQMVELADAAADRLAQRESVDLADALMGVTLEIVAKTLFDAEVRDATTEVGEALSEAMRCMIAALTSVVPTPPFVPTPTNLRGKRAVARLDAVVHRMIREHRSQPDAARTDLLSVLLAARDESGLHGLTDREVRDEAMTLLLAGHETTANALAWTFYEVARQPAVYARLQAEVDTALEHGPLGYPALRELPYCAQVVKEAMRLHPPVYMVGRRVVRDLPLGGYCIPRGSVLFVNILGMQRREDLYPRPEVFDPERFSREREALLPKHAFLPFSAGPRVCIGNHFAMMEAQLILASWLHKLRFELRDASEPAVEALLTLRPRDGIPMRVTVRQAWKPATPRCSSMGCGRPAAST